MKRRSFFEEKRACFCCLKMSHPSNRCRERLQCVICSKSHVVLMCPDLPANKKQEKAITAVDTKENSSVKDKSLSNHTSSQTLKIQLKCPKGFSWVRALIDTCSHRSYILSSRAKRLGYVIGICKEKLLHCLFGGVEKTSTHNCFEVTARYGDYACDFEVLGHQLFVMNYRRYSTVLGWKN